MKKVKRDAASFSKLSATQMKKIDGGFWVDVKNSDGTIGKVWL
jgi:hypothetical protein